MKKTVSKIAALILTMCIALSAAGCGQDISRDEQNFEKELEKLDKMDADEAEKYLEGKLNSIDGGGTAAKKTDEIVPASDPDLDSAKLDDPAYYTYCDELKAAYEKKFQADGISDKNDLRYTSVSPKIINGKIYITSNMKLDIEGNPDVISLFRYDIASKSLQKVASSQLAYYEGDYITHAGYYVSRDINSWFVRNDDIYVMYNYTEGGGGFSARKDHHYIRKAGADGSKAKSEENVYENGMLGQEEKIVYVCENGKVITRVNTNDGVCIYSPDLSSCKQIWTMTVPGEHGMNKDVKATIESAYGNCFYFTAEGKHYEYNTDTDEIREIFSGMSVQNMSVYGDLAIASMTPNGNAVSIYRISDGSQVAGDTEKCRGTSEALRFDFAGDGFYIANNGEWRKARVPDIKYDGVFNWRNDSVVLSKETKDQRSLFPLDFEHYAVRDEYGFFLRTYAAGESDEQTIVTFDKLKELLTPKDE